MTAPDHGGALFGPSGEAETTPGQGADGVSLIPDAYTQWHFAAYGTSEPRLVAASWTSSKPAQREFWRELDAAQEPQPAPGRKVVTGTDWKGRKWSYVSPHAGEAPPAPESATQARGHAEQPAPELAAAMRETRLMRQGVNDLIIELLASAAKTEPSEKSDTENRVAVRLTTIAQGGDAFPALHRQLEQARARLAVAETERDGLRTELDKRNAQHRQLLDGFTSNGSGQVQRLSGTVLARAYTDAGFAVRDDLAHLEGK